MWQLEADGTALDDWPDEYRYVTDPRTGLSSKQIDMAGQTDTSNFNRPRGFNFAWMLTAGTWRIKCTVTNPEGSSTTTTSSDITIAADTRSVVTVGSGQDYATLAAADTAIGATGNDAVKIVIDSGYTESVTGTLSFASDNVWITWDEVGSPPVITWDGATGTQSIAEIPAGAENQIWQGIHFAGKPGGDGGANSYNQRVFKPIADFWTVYDCHYAGTVGGDRLDTFLNPAQASDQGMVFKCSTAATEAYSWIASAGVSPWTLNQHCVIGNAFGTSIDESILRTNYTTNEINVSWNSFTTSSKDCVRFVNGDYQHGYGNECTLGGIVMGRIDQGDPGATETTRWEANRCQYPNIAESDGNYIVIANNVINIGTIGLRFGAGNVSTVGHEYCRFLNNTVEIQSGSLTVVQLQYDATITNNFITANLFLLATPGDRASDDYYFDGITGGSTMATWNDNVWEPLSNTAQNNFARVDSSSIADLTAWNAAAYVGTDQEVDTTLDSSFVPTPGTTVTTPDEVYDDYYGNARSSTSWAGALGAEPSSESQGVFQTFIPGLIIQAP